MIPKIFSPKISDSPLVRKEDPQPETDSKTLVLNSQIKEQTRITLDLWLSKFK